MSREAVASLQLYAHRAPCARPAGRRYGAFDHAHHLRPQPRRHAHLATWTSPSRFYEQAFGAVVTFEMAKTDDHPWMKILDLGGGALLNVFEVPAEEIIGERRRQGGRGAIDHFALASTPAPRSRRCRRRLVERRRPGGRRDPAAGRRAVAVLPRPRRHGARGLLPGRRLSRPGPSLGRACAATSPPCAGSSRRPPTEEVEAAARQYVRKVSGVQSTSASTEEAFERAVRRITAATEALLAELPPRQNRRPRCRRCGGSPPTASLGGRLGSADRRGRGTRTADGEGAAPTAAHTPSSVRWMHRRQPAVAVVGLAEEVLALAARTRIVRSTAGISGSSMPGSAGR